MSLRFRSTLLLVNPTRNPRAVGRLKKYLHQVPGIDIVVPGSKNEFLDRVRLFAGSDYMNLLIWGGDGTAHDAINALYTTDSPGPHDGKSIGFLRGGTGNGIQDSYSVPYRLKHQLEAYADSIQNNLTIDVDLLEARDGRRHLYGQLIGVGADAEVLRQRDLKARVNRRGHEHVRSGFRFYLQAGLTVLFGRRFHERLALDVHLAHGRYAFSGPRVNAQFPFDALELKRAPFMLEIGTRPYYGKLFRVCPDVVCNDGFCDLYVFDFRNRREVVGNVWYIWNGRHGRINRLKRRSHRPVIERYEVQEVELRCGSPFHYHIDGELITLSDQASDGTYRLNVRVLPQAIRFLVPRAYYALYHPFDQILATSREHHEDTT